MLQSPVPKQSLASSKQNLSCRGVFCVPQIDGLYRNVVQLPKSQDYICLPHDVAAGSNDLFVCEIYITPRSPAPSDLCASASFHYLNLALKIFPTYAPERRFPPPWSVEEQPACLFRGRTRPAIGSQVLTKEARRIAVNIVRRADLLGRAAPACQAERIRRDPVS
jgi:hypothetical protein